MLAARAQACTVTRRHQRAWRVWEAAGGLSIEWVRELGKEIDGEGELGTKSWSLPVKVAHHLSLPPWQVRIKARAVIPFLSHGRINCDCFCGTW